MFHLHRVSLCETPTAAVMLIEPLLWHVCCCLLESAGKCGLCEFYFPAKTDARLRLGCVSGSKYEKRKSRHFTKNTEFNVSGRLLVRRGIMNTRGFQENQHHGQSQSEEAFVPVTSVFFLMSTDFWFFQVELISGQRDAQRAALEQMAIKLSSLRYPSSTSRRQCSQLAKITR